MASQSYYEEKIAKASSTKELRQILEEMKKELGERNPQVIELAKRLR